MHAWAERIRKGMLVRASDGEKLGKVHGIEGEQLIIEKGLFFKKEYVAELDQVADLRDDEVWLRQGKGDFSEDVLLEDSSVPGRASRDEHRIPIVEEELVAEKRVQNAGQVNIRKDVVTEQQQVSVPVMKEDVRVERVPASDPTAAAGQASFREEAVSIPVREEEVEIRKRPVVREELRVTKGQRVEERRATETVRKERVDVDEGREQGPPLVDDNEPTRY